MFWYMIIIDVYLMRTIYPRSSPPPQLFYGKGDKGQTGHNHHTPLGGRSVEVVRRKYWFLIDGVWSKYDSCTILKDYYLNANYNYNQGT